MGRRGGGCAGTTDTVRIKIYAWVRAEAATEDWVGAEAKGWFGTGAAGWIGVGAWPRDRLAALS